MNEPRLFFARIDTAGQNPTIELSVNWKWSEKPATILLWYINNLIANASQIHH